MQVDNIEFDRYLRLLKGYFKDTRQAAHDILEATYDETEGIRTYLCLVLADEGGPYVDSAWLEYIGPDQKELDEDTGTGDMTATSATLLMRTFDDETREKIEAGMDPWDAAMFFSIWENMENDLYCLAGREKN